MKLSLDELLGYAYAEKVMNQPKMSGALDHLANEIKSRPDLASEAHKRLTQLSAMPKGRDFISDKHREFLSIAIAKETT